MPITTATVTKYKAESITGKTCTARPERLVVQARLLRKLP
jgi:hypothetical protein